MVAKERFCTSETKALHSYALHFFDYGLRSNEKKITLQNYMKVGDVAQLVERYYMHN